jgi:Glycosyltransferase family 87
MLYSLESSADVLRMRRVLFWSPVALGVVFLLLLGYHRREQALHARNDFPTFYAGAKLAGTPDLYSRAANVKLIEKLAGEDLGMMYIRPPFYAAILKPLAWLPFLWAYALFTALSLACYAWFAARFTRECPALPFLSAISIPFLADLTAGQDAAFMLAILGAAILLAREKKDFETGLVLSLCAFKLHLFLFVPVLLLLKKRWRMVGGGMAGGVALAALGTIVNGPASWISWIKVLRDPWINPDAGGMPNLHGLVAALGMDPRAEGVFIGVVCLLFLWVTLRSDNFELLFAASLVCGLLVSFHSTIVDDLVLFPVLILVLGSTQLVPLRAAAGLILTPIPYFLVLAGAPYSAVFPVSLLFILGAMTYASQVPLRNGKKIQDMELVLPRR